MDDLFQYLIWGLIIFSFLSSFLKKKEPPKQKPLPKSQQPASNQTRAEGLGNRETKTAGAADEYDILKELENLFKGEIKIPQPEKPTETQPVRDYYSSEIEDVDLEKRSDKRFEREIETSQTLENKTYIEKQSSLESLPAVERKTTIEQLSGERARVKVDTKIENGAREFEKVLESYKHKKITVSDFNRKIKNPKNIKEYILFSEILGKPKALRR